MADVKWIKITTDMFDNRKIKHLRKLPAGNDIVLIWVMLLTMAGRCNSGGMIYLTENIPYTTKMLSDELGFEESVVIMALSALEELNMITSDSAYLTIPGWEEYQSVDGLDKIREQTRKRVQKHRANQKRLACNATVTESNSTEEEREIEEDIDKEKESKTESSFPFNAEKAWNDTFELYPKKSSAVMAKQMWMDKLLPVLRQNRKDVAELIYLATKAYLDYYKENNPDDDTFRYLPKYSDWLVNDCDYWISEVEKKQRSDDS